MTTEPLLSIRDLSVDYLTPRGPVRAVDRVSLDIGPGEVFGLAGESGSGKSTAAMAALRLLPAPAVITGGQVLFRGQDLLAMDERELRALRWRKIALVFQSAMNALNPVLTIGEQISDVIVAHEGVSQAVARERAAELLRLVGIESSRLLSYPHQLSGGMRQRVVIAIALALGPEVLFMDEPTTALDVVVQKEILQQIAELKKQLGFSILFITHDLGLMLEFCDKIGILYAGRLCEVAPSRALLERSEHPYTRGLLGSFPSTVGPRQRLLGIPGSPPTLHALPAGCRFHPRCGKAEARCQEALPELREIAPRHHTACILAEGYLPRRSSAPTPRMPEPALTDVPERDTNPDVLHPGEPGATS